MSNNKIDLEATNVILSDDDKLNILNDFSKKLSLNMKDMPAEFSKIVDEDFWDLI